MSEIKDKLILLLEEFILNTKVSYSSLITEDGLVIVSKNHQNYQDEDVSSNFAAISASILSMAERGIEIINYNKILEQITIDAGADHNIEKDFTILITRIFSNVLLQIIFPKRINIGLIHFETNKIIKKIKGVIETDVSRELFSSIGSLT
ncbi:MAG: roadblock/LC7 domain-containing protein [Candidatus Thorarchaeota archaeon]